MQANEFIAVCPMQSKLGNSSVITNQVLETFGTCQVLDVGKTNLTMAY